MRALEILTYVILIFLIFAGYYYFQTNETSNVEPYHHNINVSFFKPSIKAKAGNITLYKIESSLKQTHSSFCPSNYPNYCNGKCYQKCDVGFFECLTNGTGVCIDVEGDSSTMYKKLVGIFKGNYSCYSEKIPEVVENEAIKTIPNYGSNRFPYLLDVIVLYNWTRNNIKYLPGQYSSDKSLEEIIRLKAGKCDEQAKLLAAMVFSIGGVARVRTADKCQHAWAEVFIPNKNVEWIVNEIDYYTGTKSIEYFQDEDGIWIPVDTTGANQIGKIMESCIQYLNESKVFYFCRSICPDGYFYFNGSCYSSCPGGTGVSEDNVYKCLLCPKEYPYTYNNTCVDACPNGSGLSSDGKTCLPCPEGYKTFNNTCVKCPNGYYLGKDGKCYRE